MVEGQCMASKMYVDQLKDVLVHSTSKKVAGFIAEPIQVRRVCIKKESKIILISFVTCFTRLLGCRRNSPTSQRISEGCV